MTQLQKQFNEIQNLIDEKKINLNIVDGEISKLFIKTSIKNLENKLAEIAMELTAERYANEY
jgi:hypothetical protein